MRYGIIFVSQVSNLRGTMIVSDANLLQFIKSKVNSFIKWDLVRFFHDNPHTKDTAENIAQYTTRDALTVEEELNGLVDSGVLDRQELSGVNVYSIVEDEEIRQTINHFIEACHNRNFRVDAIQQVIQGMRFSPNHDF